MQYGLIGKKLSHSFSKEIHESLANYTYELCEIAPNELENFFKVRDFKAINVTMPYKKDVIPFLDEISDEARELQAVNTIVNRDGKLYGYNTDFYGMKDMILRSGIDTFNKKALVLGTGATSRTASLVLKELGVKEIYFVSRDKKDGAITYAEAHSIHNDAQIIVNTTPVGMYPNAYTSPLDLEPFENLEAVFDAVYNPLRTQLVIEAKGQKAYGESGLYMLVSQAVHAIELFIDTKIDVEKAYETYEKITKEKENIVLIGMPSCGKTTVGKILSNMLGRDFYDLDYEIEKRIGCTISDFFETHSEIDFRNVETEITKEISTKNGIIIATGGGCATKNVNVNALRSNGRIYFIDRALDHLIPTHSRPLARDRFALENLYRMRQSIYSFVCDMHIDGNLTPNEEAEIIAKEFYQKR